MKRLHLILILLLISIHAFATDVQFRFLPGFPFLLDTQLKSYNCTAVSFDVVPITVRERDSVFFGAGFSLMPFTAPGIESFSAYDFNISAGYEFMVSDRFSVDVEALFGLWTSGEVKGTESSKKIGGSSGLSWGARASAYYNLFPELSLGGFAEFRDFPNGSGSFLKKVSVGATLRYNFTRGLSTTSAIDVVSSDLSSVFTEPLFPVFYSRYEDHPFGSITFVNEEKNDITDVTVSVMIERYMSNPSVCAKFDRVKMGQEFTAELTAFLDEAILSSLTPNTVYADITVEYKSLSKKLSRTVSVDLQTLSRNNMTWDDDRRAAAFVSSRDGSANFFANYVRSVVAPELRSNVPENIQLAAAIFSALKVYGINYVLDPASSFTDMRGSAQVDFLQFPYQTLLYHGGDCDDLSILNCALLEVLGIDAAFITCPGHIFIAFDSGVSVENAASVGRCIVQDGKVWIPLEITLCQDTFELARGFGYREWEKYPEERVLIPLRSAWEEYRTVGIADSNPKLDMPSKEAILREFRANRP